MIFLNQFLLFLLFLLLLLSVDYERKFNQLHTTEFYIKYIHSKH